LFSYFFNSEGDSDPSSSAEFGQLIYKVPWDAALEKGIRVRNKALVSASLMG